MPRSTATEPRDRQFNLSLTASEFAALKRRAEACGMRPVHYGRQLVLGSARQVSLPPENAPARLLHIQLVRLGNNLNQLVRRCHSRGEPLPADLAPLLAKIRRLIAQVPQ